MDFSSRLGKSMDALARPAFARIGNHCDIRVRFRLLVVLVEETSESWP